MLETPSIICFSPDSNSRSGERPEAKQERAGWMGRPDILFHDPAEKSRQAQWARDWSWVTWDKSLTFQSLSFPVDRPAWVT